MQKTKITRILAVVLLAVLCTACFAGCGDDKDTDNSSGGTAANGSAIYSVNGVDIKSATVVMLGETPNLQIVFANSTDKDAEFDVSKLIVKLSDGTEIANFGLTRTIAANTPRSQVAFTILSKYGVKLGNTVNICYGADKIATVTVKEF